MRRTAKWKVRWIVWRVMGTTSTIFVAAFASKQGVHRELDLWAKSRKNLDKTHQEKLWKGFHRYVDCGNILPPHHRARNQVWFPTLGQMLDHMHSNSMILHLGISHRRESQGELAYTCFGSKVLVSAETQLMVRQGLSGGGSRLI